jgi:hypothetical protein
MPGREREKRRMKLEIRPPRLTKLENWAVGKIFLVFRRKLGEEGRSKQRPYGAPIHMKMT